MKTGLMLWWILSLVAVLTCFKPDPAAAYIVSPPTTLGSMVKISTQVIVVKVEKVDRDKNVIVWRKVREIKGKWPSDRKTPPIPFGAQQTSTRSVDRGAGRIEMKSCANVDYELFEGFSNSCVGVGSAIIRRWSSFMFQGKNG